MNWTITDVKLTAANWKFRYSNGWKIELDTTIDLGGGNIGVKVNTNLGGAVDNLIPGGADIANSVPGYYTVELSYTLGDGYTATLTKTGDIPLTDWTQTQVEAVGSGVDAANPNATPDLVWTWGNVLMADNGGLPTQNGDVYTWTWNSMIVAANEGWKLRTYNYVAPPQGGSVFDVGYSNIDLANSTSNLVDDGSGNIVISVGGSYNVTLTIDAADNDKKTITIVAAK
jgi:hypothetical protein